MTGLLTPTGKAVVAVVCIAITLGLLLIGALLGLGLCADHCARLAAPPS